MLGIGVGRTERLVSEAERGFLMKVSVYKLEDGGVSVLVQASPGKGRSPVMVDGVTKANIREKVLPVITQLRAPRATQLVLPV